ncbi:hypothetical protein [Labrenzia sp. VG12]|uniref:DUF6985 domain-containing protein n=1 Tax=Labrenzia sp. VG12 TaxID=2021862 RepID=UPI00352D701D
MWRHVTPGPVFQERGNGDDDVWYAIMEAECDWEIEHGLMMVWRNGTTLCKVGGYDGHLTNADAYGDAHLSNVVYQATNPGFTTIA